VAGVSCLIFFINIKISVGASVETIGNIHDGRSVRRSSSLACNDFAEEIKRGRRLGVEIRGFQAWIMIS